MKNTVVVVDYGWDGWAPSAVHQFDTEAEAESFCAGVAAGHGESRCAWVVTDDDESMAVHGATPKLIAAIRAFLQEACVVKNKRIIEGPPAR